MRCSHMRVTPCGWASLANHPELSSRPGMARLLWKKANGPRRVRLPGLRYPKPGSVSRRRGGTKPAEAPVKSEQDALDVDIHVIAVPEVGSVSVIANVTVEVAVVVEI